MSARSLVHLCASRILFVLAPSFTSSTRLMPGTLHSSSMDGVNELYEEPTNKVSPLLIAHRGASGKYPGHTHKSYDEAADFADIIECDLSLTKDLQFICLHDLQLDSNTNFNQVFSKAPSKFRMWGYPIPMPRYGHFSIDYTLAELKQLGKKQEFSYRDQKYNDQFQIATLDEYLDIAHSKNVGVYIETKDPRDFNKWIQSERGLPDRSLESMFLDAFNNHKFAKNNGTAYFQSFSMTSITKLSELNTYSNAKMVYLSTILVPKFMQNSLLKANVKIICLNKSLLAPSDKSKSKDLTVGRSVVEELAKNGFEIHVYTMKIESQFLLHDFQHDYAKEFLFWIQNFPEIRAYFTDFSENHRRVLEINNFKSNLNSRSVSSSPSVTVGSGSFVLSCVLLACEAIF